MMTQFIKLCQIISLVISIAVNIDIISIVIPEKYYLSNKQ